MSSAHRFCPQCHRRFRGPDVVCPIDGASLHIDPFIGRLVGRWSLTDFLGQGAMGVVYGARLEGGAIPGDSSILGPLGPPSEAAVKILHATRAVLQPELVRRFEIEVRAAALLEGRHVARVFDSGTTADGHLYLAMERLRGTPLDVILARSRALRADVAATMAYQIAHALAEAHDKAIVHRDIKPGNVFVEPLPGGDWHVRVLDFGVARMRLAGVDQTRTGIVAGTPAYMSPEQLRGVRDLDGRSDIYSLGVLLYRTLAGSNPFHGDGSFVQAHHRHLHETAPPLPAGVPAALSALVARLLDKDRAARPRSMYEVQSLLVATGLIDVTAGSTAFSLDAASLLGGSPSPPGASPDATRPGLAREDTRPDADTDADRAPARHETTELSIEELIVLGTSRLGRLPEPPPDPLPVPLPDPLPDDPRLVVTAPGEERPENRRDRRPPRPAPGIRPGPLALGFAGAVIGAVLGIGVQVGRGDGTAAPVEAEMPSPVAAQPADTKRVSITTSVTTGSTPADLPGAPRAERQGEGILHLPVVAVPVVPAPAAQPRARADRPETSLVEGAADDGAMAPPGPSDGIGPTAARRSHPDTSPATPSPIGYRALLDASLAAMDAGHLEDAIRYVEGARRLRPHSTIPLQRLCLLYERAKRFEAALETCRDWRSHEPKAAYRIQIDRRIDELLAYLNR